MFWASHNQTSLNRISACDGLSRVQLQWGVGVRGLQVDWSTGPPPLTCFNCNYSIVMPFTRCHDRPDMGDRWHCKRKEETKNIKKYQQRMIETKNIISTLISTSYFGRSCECSGNHTNPLNPESTCRWSLLAPFSLSLDINFYLSLCNLPLFLSLATWPLLLSPSFPGHPATCLNFYLFNLFNHHDAFPGLPPPHRRPLSAPVEGLASAANAAATLRTPSPASFVSATTPPVTGELFLLSDFDTSCDRWVFSSEWLWHLLWSVSFFFWVTLTHSVIGELFLKWLWHLVWSVNNFDYQISFLFIFRSPSGELCSGRGDCKCGQCR